MKISLPKPVDDGHSFQYCLGYEHGARDTVRNVISYMNSKEFYDDFGGESAKIFRDNIVKELEEAI